MAVSQPEVDALSKRRVVVTGLGMVTPLGNSVAETWEGVLAGKSGIGQITRFDTTAFPCTIAGSVPETRTGPKVSSRPLTMKKLVVRSVKM